VTQNTYITPIWDVSGLNRDALGRFVPSGRRDLNRIHPS